jgi:hypothetical protein
MRNHNPMTITGIMFFIAAAIIFSILINMDNSNKELITGNVIKTFAACNHDKICQPDEDFYACSDCGCDDDNYCNSTKRENVTNCGDCNCKENDICEAGETFYSCPSDCFCNNNSICDFKNGENFINCPKDCKCNENFICDIGEDNNSCPSDCGCNKNGQCESNRSEDFYNCFEDCKCNGDGICDSWRENSENCPSDCKCEINDKCELLKGESIASCPDDCFCNNNSVCEAEYGETVSDCIWDCFCNNNGICDNGPKSSIPENFYSCPGDCFCNNNSICDFKNGENFTNCPKDCKCNQNFICDEGETIFSCPSDCFRCNADKECNPENGENRTGCPGDCAVCDRNGICEYWEYGENYLNCPYDCTDRTPPGFENIGMIDIEHNRTYLSITTNEKSNCSVSYGVLPSGLKDSINFNTNKSVPKKVLIDGLLFETLYYYKVECNDTYQNVNESDIKSFRTKNPPLPSNFPKMTRFNTSDFLGYINRLDCITQPWVEITGVGRIEFNDNCMNFTNLDLDSYLVIREGYIRIDPEKLKPLDTNMKIILDGINLTNPGILMDNNYKNSYKIKELYKVNDQKISFKVNQSGSFSAKEAITFKIWDDSDNNEIRLNQTNTFYARYLILGQQVYDDGVNCTIEFVNETENTSLHKMDFSSSDLWYDFKRSFSKNGNFTYRISCDGTVVGKVRVSLSDSFDISNRSLCGDGDCRTEDRENCSTCPKDCGLCSADWECTEWPDCINGTVTRTCTLPPGTKAKTQKPIESKNCIVPISILCNNNQLDQGEENIDCGGPCKPCATCYDEKRNAHWIDGKLEWEVGIDCGGPCPPCPTCNDDKKNQGEEQVDCGGPNCDPCPTCNDHILNQGEEDVDCGGPCSPCKKPVVEQPAESSGFMLIIIIIIAIAVVIIGSAGAVITLKPELLHKFGGLEYHNPKKDQEAQEKLLREQEEQKKRQQREEIYQYAMQSLSSGFQPAHIRNQLLSQGKDATIVDESLQKAQYQIFESQINQLAQLLVRQNLRRPDRVYAKMIKQRCHPYVAKAAIDRAIQQQIQMGIR